MTTLTLYILITASAGTIAIAALAVARYWFVQLHVAKNEMEKAIHGVERMEQWWNLLGPLCDGSCFNSWLICARPVNSDMYCPWQKVYDIGNWNAMTDAIGHCKFLHSRNPHWEYQYFANDD